MTCNQGKRLIQLFACTITLVAASGCLVDGGRHGHEHESHAVVVVPALVVVVPVPVVRVHVD